MMSKGSRSKLQTRMNPQLHGGFLFLGKGSDFPKVNQPKKKKEKKKDADPFCSHGYGASEQGAVNNI